MLKISAHFSGPRQWRWTLVELTCLVVACSSRANWPLRVPIPVHKAVVDPSHVFTINRKKKTCIHNQKRMYQIVSTMITTNSFSRHRPSPSDYCRMVLHGVTMENKFLLWISKWSSWRAALAFESYRDLAWILICILFQWTQSHRKFTCKKTEHLKIDIHHLQNSTYYRFPRNRKPARHPVSIGGSLTVPGPRWKHVTRGELLSFPWWIWPKKSCYKENAMFNPRFPEIPI